MGKPEGSNNKRIMQVATMHDATSDITAQMFSAGANWNNIYRGYACARREPEHPKQNIKNNIFFMLATLLISISVFSVYCKICFVLFCFVLINANDVGLWLLWF